MSRILHYTAVLLLLAGVAVYWWTKPSGLNPMADPVAAEAMALVQTHRAAHAPTLLQALNNRAKDMRDRGIGVRLGEWQVERERADLYLVKTLFREQGARQWFEREYIWEVDLTKKTVVAVSLPAIDLMPLDEKGPGVGPPGIPQL
jgi:hypothetical protein